MGTHQFILTIAIAFFGFAARAADVEQVVQQATTKADVVNKPTTNPQGKSCDLMKAAEAGGVNSSEHVDRGNADGNADHGNCDEYISNGGQVGKKGQKILAQLQKPAYAAIALDDEAVGCKDGKDDGAERSEGLRGLCSNFCDMSKSDRAKAYVKLMGALAKQKSGCGDSGRNKSGKDAKAGDFALDYGTKEHSQWGRKFAGTEHSCTAANVTGAGENGLCALDMLMEQMRSKDKKEQQAERGMDEKKKRQVGVYSKQSYWMELQEEEEGNPNNEKIKKAHEELQKEMDKFTPCGNGASN